MKNGHDSTRDVWCGDGQSGRKGRRKYIRAIKRRAKKRAANCDLVLNLKGDSICPK